MSLNWAQWTLFGLYAFSLVWAIATIGQPREPRSAKEAVVGLFITAGLAFLVVKAGAS